ncbi:unnamed protein product [Linum tenue]|uniref:Uncharacterized protein n=1 Tax=Linum tenue TaxID=586396 RepID=A0AAV0QTI0_9ROSI|nr:unnamed protein product [Linum tenue]
MQREGLSTFTITPRLGMYTVTSRQPTSCSIKDSGLR